MVHGVYSRTSLIRFTRDRRVHDVFVIYDFFSHQTKLEGFLGFRLLK